MYTTKNYVISLILCAVIFTGIGYFLSRSTAQLSYPSGSSENKRQAELVVGEDTFVAGLQAAYDRLIVRGHAAIVARGWGFRESKTIGGLLKESKKDEFILKVDPVSPLASLDLDERTIKITKETKAYVRVEKTEAEMKTEMEEFEKKMEESRIKMEEQRKKMEEAAKNSQGEAGSIPPDWDGSPFYDPMYDLMPPEPFGKKEIAISEIKADSRLIVSAAENIQNQKEFTALEIVWERPPVE